MTTALADRYAIERELGQGGMATVYLARDVRHDRYVALKVMRPELGAIVGAERFSREIKVVARLQHPHILSVFDSGEAADSLWFAMPYIEGESLRDRLTRDGQLPLDEAMRIAREVADALAYAHGQGVIHRDIKPENILLSGDHALVADFGIARAVDATDRLTGTGLAIGTPAYMSPEQATGDHAVDPRSDVYSLGAMLYEMLVAEPPFTGPTARAIVARALTEEPRPIRATRPATPMSIERLVQKALARNPADRYRTMTDFARAMATAGTEDISSVSDAHPVTRGLGSNRQRIVLMLGGGLTLVVVLVLGWTWLDHSRTNRRAKPMSVAAGAGQDNSIAVLPFENASGNPSDDYFSDGMADELRATLGSVPGLRVAAQTSSFRFKGSDSTVQYVGHHLGVAYLVEGRTARGGDRLRVTVELINVEDGLSRWSESFDRQAGNLFDVQEEIARTVVEKLKITLAPHQLTNPGTTSLEAHDLYQRGQFFFAKRDSVSLRNAIEDFSQAIRLDSSYALAYAGLAMAHSMMAVFSFAPAKVEFPLAQEAVRRALACDSMLAEAHTAAGIIHTFFDWDYSAAELEFNRSIFLDPSEPNARLFHTWNYIFRGHVDSALIEIRRARALDPYSVIIGLRVGSTLFWAHRYEESLTETLKALELAPESPFVHAQLGRTYVRLKKCPEAITELPYLNRLEGQSEGAYSGVVYAVCGQASRARQLAQRLERRAATGYVQPNALALIYAALGDKEKAFEWLDRAYRARDWSLVWLRVEPAWDGLRDDPRFQQLVKLVHLQ